MTPTLERALAALNEFIDKEGNLTAKALLALKDNLTAIQTQYPTVHAVTQPFRHWLHDQYNELEAQYTLCYGNTPNTTSALDENSDLATMAQDPIRSLDDVLCYDPDLTEKAQRWEETPLQSRYAYAGPMAEALIMELLLLE